ncbi:hypothetical protein DRJ16_05380 [Candidatus Woesearchaeota archaeon]|nr:MAG: hypothetical protein DRJ16_05380 [Candidatus Woesearchaeota archaeon]
MDVERIRGWAWSVANKLIEAEKGETRTLDRFMMDLRGANLPHEFSNAIVNDMTVFKRAGIDVGNIPNEVQYFSSVTEFKEAKAVIIATFHNTQITWNRVTERLKKERIKELGNEDVKRIADECYVKPEFVQIVIKALKGGEGK